MIKLSKRLKTIFTLTPENSFILDVGCDHALLDIYLYQNKKNVKIKASDINEGPLLIAKENIKKEGLEEKIKLIRGDGLDVLEDEDTVIIAGMGAETIINIITKHSLNNIKNFIICSNNDYPLLRKEFYQLGFHIEKEVLVFENKHYYVVMKYVLGKKNISKKEIKYGFLKSDPLYFDYYRNHLNSLNKVYKNIPSDFKNIRKKYLIKKEIRELTKIL